MRLLVLLQGFVPYKLLDPARLPADARNIKQGHPQEGYKNLLGKQLKFKIAQVGWVDGVLCVWWWRVVVCVWWGGVEWCGWVGGGVGGEPDGLLLWLICSIMWQGLGSAHRQIAWGVSGVAGCPHAWLLVPRLLLPRLMLVLVI